MRTGTSGFFVSSPDNNCEGSIGSMTRGGGLIGPQLLCGIGNKDNNNNYVQHKACNGCDGLFLFPHNCKCFIYSTRESEDTIVVYFNSAVGNLKGDANWIHTIIVMIQGADLRGFNKHKQRAALGMGEYPPVMDCTLFAVHKAWKYGWVGIPSHLLLFTNGIAE